jgi:hypothetical protein
MNNKQKQIKIPKCHSCYPRICKSFTQSQQKEVTFETIRILNGLYSSLMGIITGVGMNSYTKYNKIIGLLIAISFFLLNKNLLEITHH